MVKEQMMIWLLQAVKKNDPVKKTVNYWQLWLSASYCKNTVCYCF